MVVFVLILYFVIISEIIEFGLFGWVMFCYSGCYVGLKIIIDILDLFVCVELFDLYRIYNIFIDVIILFEGLNLCFNLFLLVEEVLLVNYCLLVVMAFVWVNGIDKVIFDSE